MLAVLLCGTAAVAVLAQRSGSAEGSPRELGSSRYHIVITDSGPIKLDTATGLSWHLQLTPESMKQRGVYYVWTAILTRDLPDSK